LDLNDRKKRLWEVMEKKFGTKGKGTFFRAPGRVDLMGAHTDYNEGFVLVSTIDRDILVNARKREDGEIRLFSLNTDQEVRVHMDSLKNDPAHGWANYPKGVISQLIKLEVPFSGIDVVLHGNIPIGGNLSSSAALEAVICEAALGVNEQTLTTWEKINLCRSAENDFIGMPCGVMDQFAVFMGTDKNVLLLDCKTREFQALEMNINDAVLVIIDPDLSRELVGSNYAQRVKECDEAIRIFKKTKENVKTLRDVDLNDLEKSKQELGDVLFRRVKHVLTENERVKTAGEAAKNGDAEKLGEIMDECQKSCTLDYENSTPEIDELHDLISKTDYSFGSRICGAGWGGCMSALIKSGKENDFETELSNLLKNKERKITFRPVKASAGAGPL
jgi:galactokinase